MKTILTLFACALAVGAQIAAAADLDTDFAQMADARIQTYVSKNQFSGTVLVARDGKPVFRKAYGLANREWNIPNTVDTKFRLGSITKQFTATLILHLAEQGKLKLDDPVSKYYTDAPAAWAKITVHHLLTHTSGIPSYTALPDFFPKHSQSPLTPGEIVKLTQSMPLEFEPGTQFRYDNTGYILLGYIVEKVTGKPYAAYLKEIIFDPLGMKNSGYDVWSEVLPNRASGYSFKDGVFTNAAYLDMTLPYAAGSLYSTVDDLLIWDQSLYTNKILTEASRKKMFTPFLQHYAYGWIVEPLGSHYQAGHGGGINGFSTDIKRFPEDKATVIALCNLDSGSPGSVTSDLAYLLFGEKIPEPPKHKEIALDPKLLEPLTGHYELTPQFAIDITRDGDQLSAQATGQPKFPLFAESETKFFLKVVDAEVDFEKDASGKAVSLTLHQNGAEMKGVRK
jgi:CubicO group peptidase (beta-lactamase class C family)